jgi:lysophospholipase
VLATVLTLAACGQGDRAAFVDSRPPPGLAERFYPPENWAWGLIAMGGPPQRYGVAAPRVVARAQVLIVPDYGESAETWFETVRDLTDAGDVVWIIEGVGQGGSGRLGASRDLGELKRFDTDVAAVRAMVGAVIRPGGAPLTVVGQGVGALVAARAVETGARPAALILSAPDCRPASAEGFWRLIGLGGLRAAGDGPWRRDAPDAFARGWTHDSWRGSVTRAWQLANPDLRMGGPSLDWMAAFGALQAQARADGAQVTAPTLILDAEAPSACLPVAGAERRVIAGADRSLELEDDAHRGIWLTAIQRFIAATTPGDRSNSRPHGA